VLGQGTFGQVVKCQNVKTGDIVAVKVIKEIYGAKPDTMFRVSSSSYQLTLNVENAQKLRRERTTWGRLRHPNVLPLYGFADDHELFQPFGALISPVGF